MYRGFSRLGRFQEPRVPVRRRGTLKFDKTSYPRLVEGVSQNGIQIMSSREFPVGQLLEFGCGLFSGKFLEYKVEVGHVSDQSLGLRIMEIDDRGISPHQLFLEDQYADRL